MEWRIYYDRGTYSDADGPIENAPCEGVVIVVQLDPDVGREVLHVKDFYVWDTAPGHTQPRWWGCDRWGMEDYLRRPGWRKVLAGRNVAYQLYSELYDTACHDPDFPPKSGLLLTEEPKR